MPADFDFSQTLPAIDQNLNGVWSEQDKDKYNKTGYYLVKMDAEESAKHTVWDKLVTETVPWKPNEGPIMRGVIVEPTPIVRQEARPIRIQNDPLRDIVNVEERTVDAYVQSHEFVSPHFNFLPSYQDFMEGNLIPTRKNIDTQIRFYKEFFYRTSLWDSAPFVYVAGHGLVQAPTGVTAAADGVLSSNKTDNWLAAECFNNLPLAAGSGILSFEELFKISSAFFNEVGGSPYEGNGQPGGDSRPLNERVCLVTSNDQWLQFVDDPWLKENRPINMNIVTEAFQGDIFGKIRTKIERYPLRFSLDANLAPTRYAPQTREVSAASGYQNRTVPNLNYTKPSISQVEVSFLVGGRHGKKISTGAPPEFFAGGTSDPQKLAGMSWNGLVYANKMFGIPKKMADGTIIETFNDFGRYVRFQSYLTLGMIVAHGYNVLPIIHRRTRGISTLLPVGS